MLHCHKPRGIYIIHLPWLCLCVCVCVHCTMYICYKTSPLPSLPLSLSHSSDTVDLSAGQVSLLIMYNIHLMYHVLCMYNTVRSVWVGIIMRFMIV